MGIITQFRNLAELTEYFKDEQSCRDYFEAMCWNGEPQCPNCQSVEVYLFKDGKFFKCNPVRRNSRLWLELFLKIAKFRFANGSLRYIFSLHTKGISSVQLVKDIGITQKSAWHVLHRIRHAFGLQDTPELGKTVKVDETYAGGKRNGQRGCGAAGNTAIVGIVERGGKVVTKPVKSVDAKTLKSLIMANVKEVSTVNTDSFASYNRL